MSRYAIRALVTDLYGTSIPGAKVKVYEEGGLVLAEIYAAKTGGTPIVGSELTSDSAGRVLAYVDSATYPAPFSFFDLVATATGYETRTEPDVKP
jgi:hypothetical protein